MPVSSPRIRYFFGDLIATVVACSGIAAATGITVPSDWPHWAAMPAGMAFGMALSIPFLLAAGQLLGMIEPMIQIMLGGMVAGMIAVHDPALDLPSLAILGGTCGASTSVAVGVADWILRKGNEHG